MNRCCKSLLIKNVTSCNSVNSKLAIDQIQTNFRVLSTIVQYSLFDKSNLNKHKNLADLHKKNTQIRYLTRDSPQKKLSFKKNSKSHSIVQKYQTVQDINKLNFNISESKSDQTDIFKPLEVKPITNAEEDIGFELGGKLEKCNLGK